MKFKKLMLTVAAAALVAAPIASAQDTATAEKTDAKMIDVAGTWRWSDEQGTDHRLDIKSEEKVLVAIYNGVLDDLKSKKVTIKGDKLTIDFEGDFGGTPFEATYEGTVKGDEVSGTLSISSDQGSQEMPWEAKRSVELADLVGKWSLKVETDDGGRDLDFEIAKDGTEFKGTCVGAAIGECPVKDMKIKDNKFTFTITGQLQGTDFEAACDTKVQAGKLEGEMVLDLGGQEIALPISGKPIKANK